MVDKWADPLFRAFLDGAWFLYWTSETLYWVAKPVVHVQPSPNPNERPRLHNENYAAVESDVENLYFYEGVLVPAFVVVRPDWITEKHIQEEKNAEVRRIMMKRYGWDRLMSDAKLIDRHENPLVGELWEKTDLDGVKIRILKCLNGTPERDGSLKWYFLRVPVSVGNSVIDASRWTYPICREMSREAYVAMQACRT